MRHLILLLLIVGLTGSAHAKEAGPDPNAIKAFMDENLARTGLPGAAVAVVSRNGVVYLGGHGRTSSGGAVGADTPLRVGSLAKSMTAFAVLQLVDRGLVELDAPVSRYVPEFQPEGPAHSVTVRRLLNQTSGLSDAGFPEMSRPQPQTLAAAAERLSDAHLGTPGKAWSYHNPNYHLLARLVERVDGRPFPDYLRDEVFRPAGMTRTLTTLRAEQPVAGLDRGFVHAYGLMIPRAVPPHFVGGSGGVVTTASDMGRWLSLHLNDGVTAEGRRLISSQSLKAMTSVSSPSGDGYAFGWSVDRRPNGVVRVGHGGILFTYSADQSFYSNGYGLALLFNSAAPGGPEPMSFVTGLEALITGKAPTFGQRVSLYVDLALGGMALVALGLAVWQVRRAGRWSIFWRRRAWPLSGLRLLIGLIPLCLLALLPDMVGWIFGGRDVTWTTLTYWPSLLIAFALPAAGCIAITAARLQALHRVG